MNNLTVNIDVKSVFTFFSSRHVFTFKKIYLKRFYRATTCYSAVYMPSSCVAVCHKSVFFWNG